MLIHCHYLQPCSYIKWQLVRTSSPILGVYFILSAFEKFFVASEWVVTFILRIFLW